MSAFDGEVGLGEVEEEGSGTTFPFHCTQIAGGSRQIEVGAAVTFDVVAGRLGRWEAGAVTPA